MVRPRIGLIVPSSNTVVEPDFAQAAGSLDLSVHVSRMYLADTTPEAEQRMIDVHAPRAADELASAHCDVIAFACTSAGALIGLEGEQQLIRRLGAQVGCPVVSTNESVFARLNQLGARRVAVITAYVDSLNRGIRSTLEERGIEVTELHGMGITDNFAIAEVSEEQILQFAVENITDRDVDAVFVSCTNLRARGAAPALAAEFGVPVVTSNTATIDLVLQTLGLATPDALSPEDATAR